MASLKRQRLTKKKAFQAVLEYLKYALATKTHFLRVVDMRLVTQSSLPPELAPSQVLIKICGIPVKHERSGRFPIAARTVAQFFESWEVQEQFLHWYGRRIAEAIPKGSAAAKLKKSLANLRKGGLGKLPPQIVLKAQYDRLALEIRSMQSQSPGLSPLTHKGRESILKFGRKESAHWVQVIENKQVDLDQILRENPKVAAKLILSKQYACSEESIHWGLFRSS